MEDLGQDLSRIASRYTSRHMRTVTQYRKQLDTEKSARARAEREADTLRCEVRKLKKEKKKLLEESKLSESKWKENVRVKTQVALGALFAFGGLVDQVEKRIRLKAPVDRDEEKRVTREDEGVDKKMMVSPLKRECATCGKDESPHLCSRCRSVRYCSPMCQKKHWKRHKKVCGVAAAAATTKKGPLEKTTEIIKTKEAKGEEQNHEVAAAKLGDAVNEDCVELCKEIQHILDSARRSSGGKSFTLPTTQKFIRSAQSGNTSRIRRWLDVSDSRGTCKWKAIASEALGRALSHVTSSGHLGLCNLFLEHGAHPDGVVTCTSSTDASNDEKKDVVVVAPVDRRTVRTVRPLHAAIRSGYDAITKRLIEAGADLGPDDDGTTPLHVAAFANKSQICELLLKNGSVPNALNGQGDSPADIARKQRWHAVQRILEDPSKRLRAFAFRAGQLYVVFDPLPHAHTEMPLHRPLPFFFASHTCTSHFDAF